MALGQLFRGEKKKKSIEEMEVKIQVNKLVPAFPKKKKKP